MACSRLLFSAIVFVHLLLVFGKSRFYVHARKPWPCIDPCMSLNDYVKNATSYFISNTTFVFLEGRHYLDTSLKIESACDLAMEGLGSSSNIYLLVGAGISWNNSLHVTLRDVRIIYDGRNDDALKSALYFQNCELIYLIEVNFTGINDQNTRREAHGVKMLCSSATISNCTFSGGYSKEGGAIYIRSSNVSFSGISLFENNTAFTRGGAIRSSHSSLTFSGNMYFNHNEASDGGAIYSSSSNLILEGDAVFAYNYGGSNGGGVYLENSNITCRKKLLFHSNSANCSGGSAYLDNSDLRISGAVTFHKNSAQRFGGGLALANSAQLVFQLPVTVIFLDNEADYGGAIQNADLFFSSYENQGLCRIEDHLNCFFKIEVKNTSHDAIYLNFTNNFARLAGSDIHDGALDRCRVQTNQNENGPETGLHYLQNISTFNHRAFENSSSSPPPQKICFCMGGGSVNCLRSYEVRIPRGRTFNVTVVAVGQNGTPVPSGILHTFASRDNYGLHMKTFNDGMHPRSCYNISFQPLSASSSASFKIYPKDCVGLCAYTRIDVKFQDCPAGFSLVTNKCKCERNLLNILGSEDSCNIETGLIRRPGRLWIKPIFENGSYAGFVWNKYCPAMFCKDDNSSVSVWLNFSSSNVDNQCQENRVGVMCGTCKQNYSLTLDNFDCKICSNRSLGMLVVFMLYGIVLIAIFLALQMTVAAGTLNGLILYVNVINITKGNFFPPGLKREYEVFSVFISWMNLDGLLDCFYDGLDVYSLVWLQFIFPFYLWALIGLIAIASKLSTRVVRLFGSNIVAVLSTVILMSFTRLLHASGDALLSVYVETSNGSRQMVWYLDPSISYFKGKHALLALFAIGVVSFLIIPYFFLLLFGFLLQAHSNRKGFRWVNKFKPFLDAYYAPFHKKTRYWTGFMLMVRGGLYISFMVTKKKDNDFTLLVVALVFIAIAMIPWLGIRVYEKRYLDVLEASFILNICFLSIATYNGKMLNIGKQETLSSISVGIALAEFVGIIVFHAVLLFWKMKFLYETKQRCVSICRTLCNYFALRKSKTVGMKEEESTAMSTVSIFDIRESLLEEESVTTL